MDIPQLTNSLCQITTNCSQCWETCQQLQDGGERQLICSRRDCGAGCKEACRFPLLSRTGAAQPQHEEVLLLSNSRVSWPGTAAVYVVMGQRSRRPWAQLLQTVDSSAPIPPDLDLESVRVLEVQWRGLTKVYSPPPESPLSQVQAVLRSLGLEKRVLGANSIETSVTSTPKKVAPSSSFLNLRVVSMTQQSVLVLTQVCWQAGQTTPDSLLMYLVTWQLGEGVLRGNLLTNSSCATLSLWPDTTYQVKVALLSPGSHEGESEPLVVDTHLVHTEDFEDSSVLQSHVTTVGLGQHVTLTHHGTQSPDPGTQLVVGVAAAVIVFLVVTLSLTWRWRHRLSLPHTKLSDEEILTPNIYRVFPPAVRLMGERPDTLADMFSSTDNLLECK
ncbi:hypothetical protein J6590_103797 [Homalodisca vitripennis]|nr:hypothetical protein J6590_103797 [Homalodisca vitripennis]